MSRARRSKGAIDALMSLPLQVVGANHPMAMRDSHAESIEGESIEFDAIPASTPRDVVRGCIERHRDAADVTTLLATGGSEREPPWRWAERAEGRR